MVSKIVLGLKVIAVIGFAVYHTNKAESCPSLFLVPEVADKNYLDGHVINTMLTQTESLCRIMCFTTDTCVSYNYKKETTECEISDSDHIQHPEDFVQKAGYVYVGTENGCQNNSCANNSTCRTNLKDETKHYWCVCTPDYEGPTCNQLATWYKALGWCLKSSGANSYTLFTGDFNGDGRHDLLCHGTNTGYKSVAFANSTGQFNGTSWEKAELKWCFDTKHEDLHLGDFNGDNKTDLLCRSTNRALSHVNPGHKWIGLANNDGVFVGNSWQGNSEWCNHAGAKLKIGDFNKDDQDDMLCYDGTRVWIATVSNNGNNFAITYWENETKTWCNQGNGTDIYVGDFNNDNRDDLLCHDKSGKNTVRLAQAGDSFNSDDWSSNSSWCSGEDFHVGDMNGDGRADMLCHFNATGQTSIVFATANGQNLFSSSPIEGRSRLCSGNKALYLADFNGDGKDDMLCHDSATGEIWIDYSSFK